MSSPLWSPGKSNNPSLIKLNELAKAKNYSELHKWSIDNSADFWRFVVSDSDVIGDFGDTAISGAGAPTKSKGRNPRGLRLVT